MWRGRRFTPRKLGELFWWGLLKEVAECLEDECTDVAPAHVFIHSCIHVCVHVCMPQTFTKSLLWAWLINRSWRYFKELDIVLALMKLTICQKIWGNKSINTTHNGCIPGILGTQPGGGKFQKWQRKEVEGSLERLSEIGFCLLCKEFYMLSWREWKAILCFVSRRITYLDWH